MFWYGHRMDLASWEVEQLRRSIAMLAPETPAGLSRERALELLDQLERVLLAVERSAPPDTRL
jgi:hypothetical protein